MAIGSTPRVNESFSGFNEANRTPIQREILAVGRAALHLYMHDVKVVPYVAFQRRRSERSGKGQS